jgi:hypothetical protein
MLPINRRHAIAGLLIAVFAASCGTAVRGTEPGRVDAVKAGPWGGPHIAMTVAASGTAIEFDCGKGTVDGAIDADRDGGFTATGTFQPERPGPATPNPPPGRPMRLSGRVQGDEMQLKIVLTDRDEEIGSFTLAFNTTPRLTKCR